MFGPKKNLIKWCVVFFMGCVWTPGLLWAKVRPLVLVAFTASEAKSFQVISGELSKTNTPHTLVGVGVAYAVLKDHPHLFSLRTQCNVRAPLQNHEWPARQRLPEGDLMRLTSCLSPHIMVVGSHSRLQAQVASVFQKKGTHIIAFYDDFYPLSAERIVKSALPRAQEIFLPAQSLVPFFRQAFPGAGLYITGRPNNETWIQPPSHNTLKTLRKMLVPPAFENHRILFYVGGHSPAYNDSFEEVVKSVKNSKNVLAFFSPYPGDDGQREKSLIQMHGVDHFLPLPVDVRVEEAAHLADRILCHRSNTGIQAALAGLAVAYYDTSTLVYRNPLTDNEIIPRLRTQEDLHTFINGSYIHHPHTPQELSQKMGWPLGAATTIAFHLKKRLSERLGVPSLKKLPWQPLEIWDGAPY